mgnify:CR=1 FL=1
MDARWPAGLRTWGGRLAPKRFSAAVAERRAVKRALRELARGGAELEAEI